MVDGPDLPLGGLAGLSPVDSVCLPGGDVATANGRRGVGGLVGALSFAISFLANALILGSLGFGVGLGAGLVAGSVAFTFPFPGDGKRAGPGPPAAALGPMADLVGGLAGSDVKSMAVSLVFPEFCVSVVGVIAGSDVKSTAVSLVLPEVFAAAFVRVVFGTRVINLLKGGRTSTASV